LRGSSITLKVIHNPEEVTAMMRWAHLRRSERWFAAATTLLALTMAAGSCQTAFAIIMGGEGNRPISDPGWPQGAAAIVNNPARIAYWEGPPFGGGQFHAECRGDARSLNAVLADFAELDVKMKRLVVHDGIAQSFWLNPNRDPAKEAAARMDWAIMVWVPAAWERLRNMPLDLKPADVRDADTGPPAQIDVYTGGNVRWSDVTVPKALTVIDERLEAHGFTLADGTVLEGKVVNLTTQQPLAARMRLERVEPQPKGGYRYTVAAETIADAQGHWVLKKAPAGWYRVVVAAEGYVPRVASYARFDGQPGWSFYECGLTHAASVSGQVTDEAGSPLADVEVRLTNVVAGADQRYQSPDEYLVKTGADGRFQLDQVPAGRASMMLVKSGYCRPGLGPSISVPTKDVALSMMKAARVRVTVDFSGTVRPEGYIVEMEPEGGSAVGKWGGSANIDANNQFVFENVPPGKYVLTGHPNPSSADQRTEPLAVDLKGGQSAEIKVTAK
jgi:hypothetical protein